MWGGKGKHLEGRCEGGEVGPVDLLYSGYWILVYSCCRCGWNRERAGDGWTRKWPVVDGRDRARLWMDQREARL